MYRRLKNAIAPTACVLVAMLSACGLRPLDIDRYDDQTVIKPNVDGLLYRVLDSHAMGDETVVIRQHVITRALSLSLESAGLTDNLADATDANPIGTYALALGPIYALHTPTPRCAHRYALAIVEHRDGTHLKMLSMGCDAPLAFQPLTTKQVVVFRTNGDDPMGRIVTSSGTSDSLPLSTWFDDPEAIVSAARARRADLP